MLPQKPNVRFLEVFPVRVADSVSHLPVPTSGIARIGAERKPRGGERNGGSPSGCGGRYPTIRGGLSSPSPDL